MSPRIRSALLAALLLAVTIAGVWVSPVGELLRAQVSTNCPGDF